MVNYDKSTTVQYYIPDTTYDDMLNATGGTPTAVVAAKTFPANPTLDELPDLEPQRNDEEVRTAGQGLEVDAIHKKGWEDGAGSKRATCIFGLHIPDSFDKTVIGDISGDVAEIFTVTCLAKASCSASTYFCFDLIDADADYPDLFYYVWLNVGGSDADPAVTGRTAIEADISGATTDTDVALIIKNLIDALTDAGAAVGAGDEDHIITVTNGTAGAVIDARDGLDGTTGVTGFTVAVTTQGVTTKTITEGTTFPNVAYHNEHEASGIPIRRDMLGVTQNEYLWEIESGGVIEEERTYQIAHSVAGSDLGRPIGPDGLAWTSTEHPFERVKTNFTWGDLTFTFKYNSVAIGCTITAVHIRKTWTVDYKREGGSNWSNARYLTKREYEITMTVRPTATTLYDIQRLHVSGYAGDITLTVKAQRGSDTNDYIQWAFTKLRLLPFDLKTPSPEDYTEEYEITLRNAPNNVCTVTIKDELSKRYYGVA